MAGDPPEPETPRGLDSLLYSIGLWSCTGRALVGAARSLERRPKCGTSPDGGGVPRASYAWAFVVRGTIAGRLESAARAHPRLRAGRGLKLVPGRPITTGSGRDEVPVARVGVPGRAADASQRGRCDGGVVRLPSVRRSA